jgi:hypothetical protein
MRHLINKIAVEELIVPGKSIIRDASELEDGLRPLGTANQAPAALLSLKLAALPVGYYRGQLVFYDVDKQVNQPLVTAERKYILGVLDGRLEGYDLKTAVIAAGVASPAVVTAALTVPAGQVWYINAVVVANPKDGAATILQNWRCSLWPDLSATPNAAGQAYHAADVSDAGAGAELSDLFGLATVAAVIATPTGWTNKNEALRLPGGTTITASFAVTAAPATGFSGTLRLYGYVGKQLVA